MTAIQQTLRLGRPLWIRGASRRNQHYPSLSGNHVTSVTIVGGGMIGALVAHAFASAGISTIVLEAGMVGRGSTAASSALLLQEPDFPRHWFALGYGGNGMTFGFLAARLLLERWQGAMSRDHALFEFGRIRRR